MIHPVLAKRRVWPIALAAGAVALTAAWIAAWYYSAGLAEQRISAWRAQEEQQGRIHSCGRQTIGGFPFRIEVRCVNAVAELRRANPPLTIAAKEIVFSGQLYNFTVSNADIAAPFTISEPTRRLWTGNWSQAHVNVHGVPAALDRLTMAIDGLTLDEPGATVLTAGRVELDARVVMGSARHNPVLDVNLKAAGAVVSAAYAPREPADLELSALLRGLRNLSPQRLPALLQEFQASDGRLEITKARLKQGDTVAAAAGVLGLSANGRPEGSLRLTVAGVERLVQALGLDRALTQTTAGRSGALGLDRAGSAQSALDRLIPGLGGAARNKAAEAGLQMGIALLGQPTELEGRRATAIALRFADGAAMFGPIKLGQVPPLY